MSKRKPAARKLTAKQLENVRYALSYLIADFETMSTESDKYRTRRVGNGIKTIERLIESATPKEPKQ